MEDQLVDELMLLRLDLLEGLRLDFEPFQRQLLLDDERVQLLLLLLPGLRRRLEVVPSAQRQNLLPLNLFGHL